MLLNSKSQNFRHRKVTVANAITILAKNNILVDDKEAAEILDFLYIVAKGYSIDKNKDVNNHKEKSNP